MATTVEVAGTPLGYHHEPGARDLTFVFVNALTGTSAMWEASIAPSLRERGYGTLAFDLPGQGASPLPAAGALTAETLTAATAGLVHALVPAKPVFVGLSIGGLFALQAHRRGTPAAGFVLINTLRKPGPRLAWITGAVARLARLGGGRRVRDAYAPLLFAAAWLAAHRGEALTPAACEGLGADAAERRLLEAGCGADGDVAYEDVRAAGGGAERSRGPGLLRCRHRRPARRALSRCGAAGRARGRPPPARGTGRDRGAGLPRRRRADR
jgi:pimeloyl-ACP methyl ester carboxylesterase